MPLISKLLSTRHAKLGVRIRMEMGRERCRHLEYCETGTPAYL